MNPDPAARAPEFGASHPPRGRWVAVLYLVLACGLVPWVIYLSITLPDREVSQNYRLAWVGFDVLLIGALIRTAYLAWRRSPFVVNVASATATLLVVDAWFDVATATPGRPMLEAVLSAALVELPGAALSIVIAGRAQLKIARTGAVRISRISELPLPHPRSRPRSDRTVQK